MPLDQAREEDRQFIRTNEGPEEGHVICATKTAGGEDEGIAQDGRRLGYLTRRGCSLDRLGLDLVGFRLAQLLLAEPDQERRLAFLGRLPLHPFDG